MTRFAWLQIRTQTLVVAAGLALLAAVAAVTGVHLSHLYHAQVAHCRTGCDLVTAQFLAHDGFLQHAFDLLSRVMPAVLGVFWGAPLVARELESGTYRLAWTQSVSRARWLLTKLAVGAAATLVVSGVLTLVITWWYRSVDPLSTTPFAVFDRRDVAPVGYALFAFALGAVVGALVRRTVPAMATTLAGYVACVVAVGLWVRPHLLSPLHLTQSALDAGRFGVASTNGSALTLVADGSGPPGSWTLSSHLVTTSGHRPGGAELAAWVHRYCPDVGLPPVPPPGHVVARVLGKDAGRACLDQAAKTFRLAVTYQPGNRYWTFQWLELGVFVVLAVAAAVTCWWWVTRRAR